MNKKKFRGEYLAPKVKVVKLENQTMLCVSQNSQFESYEYGEDW